MICANEEFASAVEKLYQAEEEQVKEKESLEREMRELEERLELEKSVLILKQEKETIGIELSQITESLSTAVQEYETLSTKK